MSSVCNIRPIWAYPQRCSVTCVAAVQGLALYPHNVQLLHLLVLSEQRAHAHARLRQFLHAALSTAPTPTLLAVTLATEAAHPGSEVALLAGRGALSGRLHSLLEQCASDRRLSSCPDLWRVYLR
jgi:hypothetical protein